MNSSSASLLSVSDDELVKLLGGKLKEKEREKTRCEEVLARKRRAPWDSWTCYFARENNHLECLNYAKENGCPDTN
jgi:hypothetical protein